MNPIFKINDRFKRRSSGKIYKCVFIFYVKDFKTHEIIDIRYHFTNQIDDNLKIFNHKYLSQLKIKII